MAPTRAKAAGNSFRRPERPRCGTALASSTANFSRADTPAANTPSPSSPSRNTMIYSDATKLADLIRTRQVSPVGAVQAHLDGIEAVNPKINAIVTIADGGLDAAKEAEAAAQGGAGS